jgi:hypothetical protein
VNSLLAKIASGLTVDSGAIGLARQFRETPHRVTADHALQAFAEIWHGLADWPRIGEGYRLRPRDGAGQDID